MHLNHSLTSTLLLLLFARAMEASPSSFRGLVTSSISRSLSDPRDNHEAMVLSKKQVVFFAGPHGAASGQMESFFSLFDNNAHHKKHGITKALIHWAWPLVQDEPFDVFDRLVTEPDNQEFKEKLLTTVSQRFEESENGIIVGTAQFDEVGADAIYDGLTAMKEIVSLLNLEDSDVTVVVNYKAPRLDQWISAWKHEKGEVETSTYEDFLCLSHNKEEEKRKRFNMLGCQMNPLGISKIFLDQGWKVHLIDMEGVENAERDVAHTIGCRILMGQCTDGFLGGDEHGGCRHDINHIERPFDALDDVESSKIEELFRNRDCGYKPLLEKNIDNGNLIIEYQDSLWEDCDPDRKEYYEGLLDATDTLYYAFLSQLNCKDGPKNTIDINEALGKPIIEQVIDGFFEVIVVPCIFLAGVGYIVMMMLKKGEQRRLDERPVLSAGAEMTTYPSSAFRDGDEEEDEVAVDSVPDDEGLDLKKK